jgi:hypothetical protein
MRVRVCSSACGNRATTLLTMLVSEFAAFRLFWWNKGNCMGKGSLVNGCNDEDNDPRVMHE